MTVNVPRPPPRVTGIRKEFSKPINGSITVWDWVVGVLVFLVALQGLVILAHAIWAGEVALYHRIHP